MNGADRARLELADSHLTVLARSYIQDAANCFKISPGDSMSINIFLSDTEAYTITTKRWQLDDVPKTKGGKK